LNLFLSEENDGVLNSFISEALNNSYASQDSLMIIMTFMKDKYDTLVSMAAVPYPSSLQIDESMYSNHFHKVISYRGYIVSIYDLNGGEIIKSMVSIPGNRRLDVALKNDMKNQHQRDNLYGSIKLFSVKKGELIEQEIDSTMDYPKDDDDCWEVEL
jgi:hypothetical protein